MTACSANDADFFAYTRSTTPLAVRVYLHELTAEGVLERSNDAFTFAFSAPATLDGISLTLHTDGMSSAPALTLPAYGKEPGELATLPLPLASAPELRAILAAFALTDEDVVELLPADKIGATARCITPAGAITVTVAAGGDLRRVEVDGAYMEVCPVGQE